MILAYDYNGLPDEMAFDQKDIDEARLWVNNLGTLKMPDEYKEQREQQGFSIAYFEVKDD